MARVPDGLIFEYSVDYKGVELAYTERELVKCQHCKYAQSVIHRKNDKRPDFKCSHPKLDNTYVRTDYFCAYGERETNSL